MDLKLLMLLVLGLACIHFSSSLPAKEDTLEKLLEKMEDDTDDDLSKSLDEFNDDDDEFEDGDELELLKALDEMDDDEDETNLVSSDPEKKFWGVRCRWCNWCRRCRTRLCKIICKRLARHCQRCRG